ncbi:toxin-antitoxin system HicB family antitoxin [Streptomyces caniscabiei]|uniref:toxin-antitoxin system HicB family antitoxin n=1 Tax=Streptomyces caniscabiei TaxID=2746961 RepID=UPI0007658DD4|nr:toxin-antitoxin system HicB family antitoxin [Streptomyces caniscabiei]
MDLTPYVDRLRQELVVAAEAGGDEARALAERLVAPLDSATRLTLLTALSAAMGEVTRELAPGSVDVRLRGADPEFVVTLPPAPVQEAAAPWVESPALPPLPESDDGASARINFRLPAHLKARLEEAAGREGLSVNAWLVRATSAALTPGPGARTAAPPASGPNRAPGDRNFTGWVR